MMLPWILRPGDEGLIGAIKGIFGFSGYLYSVLKWIAANANILVLRGLNKPEFKDVR